MGKKLYWSNGVKISSASKSSKPSLDESVSIASYRSGPRYRPDPTLPGGYDLSQPVSTPPGCGTLFVTFYNSSKKHVREIMLLVDVITDVQNPTSLKPFRTSSSQPMLYVVSILPGQTREYSRFLCTDQPLANAPLDPELLTWRTFVPRIYSFKSFD